jgi:tetratricopeptide (TPR) repeat protein
MRPLTWFFLFLLVTSAGAQQKPPSIPARPHLGEGADTNDAKAYYQWGLEKLNDTPGEAVRGFYWATRIDPSSAEAFYARWAATHLSDRDRYIAYRIGVRSTRGSAEIRSIDSLYLRALTLNPFLYRRFERLMFEQLLEAEFHQRYGDQADMAAVNDFVRRMFTNSMDPGTRAIVAYSQGNFPRALEQYAAALSGYKYKWYIHADRGQLFYILGSYDSATVSFKKAVNEWRAIEDTALVFVYQSKALWEHSLGMIQEHQGHADSAREAYGRALQEDLSYSPAHVRLSVIDLAKGDTAGALSEMDIATQLQPSDGYDEYLYGRMLIMAGHDAEALEVLKKAVAIEPYYAAPRYLTALLYDAAGMKEEAVAEYRGFIRTASENDRQLAYATQRVSELSAAAPPAAPAKP